MMLGQHGLHTKGTGPAVSSTPQTPPLTLEGQLRLHPPRCAKQAHKLCFLRATLGGSEGSPCARSQWDMQLLHGHSWTWMLALGKLSTCRSSLACTGINNLNTGISKYFFTQKSWPQTHIWFVVFKPKNFNIKTLPFALGCWKKPLHTVP